MNPSLTARQAILGVPLDPNKKPSGSELVRAFEQMDTRIIANSAGAIIRNSLSALNSTATPAAGAMAWVMGDATVANNGVYENTGTSGSPVWTRRGDLPFGVIRGINVGAGSANAIVATTSIPVPSADGAALIILPVVATNDASPVTVAFNGGPSLTIVDVDGSPIGASALSSGMIVVGMKIGSTFMVVFGPKGWSPLIRVAQDGSRRVFELYDWTGGQGSKPSALGYLGASGVVQSIADGLDVRGPAGPSGPGTGDMLAAAYDPGNIEGNAFNGFPVATRTALKALDTSDFNVAYLTEAGREGRFVWRTGDYSAEITADPSEGIYIKADAVAATSGAWVRSGANWKGQPYKMLNLAWLGYVADDATDNTAAVNAAIAIANLTGFTTIVVPVGIGRVGVCSPIIKNEVRFKGEGAQGHSTLKGTAATMLKWGDADSPVIAGGGCDGIGFMGNSSTIQRLIIMENSGDLAFNSCKIDLGVATLMQCGNSAGTCNIVHWNNLTGRCPNIAAPLFILNNGGGFFLHDSIIYNEAYAGGGSALDGRYCVFVNGEWNTVSVRGCFTYLFDYMVFAYMTSGKTLGDVALENNWFDEMNQTIVLAAEAGGAVGNVSISNNEMTGKKGDAIAVSGPGYFTRIDIRGCPIREMKKHGIAFYSRVEISNIANNNISQVNEPCNFTGSISGTTLTFKAGSRTGHPGGTLAVGDVIQGAGVAVGTTVTALGTGTGMEGSYTVSISQTVSERPMSTATGHYSALLVEDAGLLVLSDNNFGRRGDALGEGFGAYGVRINSCDQLMESNNAAVGLTANWNVSGIGSASSCESFWLPYTVTLSSSGGGAFGSASALGVYQRAGSTVRYSISGSITTVGSATGFLQFSIPVSAAASPAVSHAGGGAQVGAACTSTVLPGASTGQLVKYDASATATVVGNFNASGEYRCDI